jgi:tripartite-type tricarboxylate transporter receptor subunit TctC
MTNTNVRPRAVDGAQRQAGRYDVLCGRHALVALLVAASIGPLYAAQPPYPARPIRVIVPQSPGASNDTITRIIATKMSEVLGQQLVLDNRPGAGGIIAGEMVANANPDGYTIYSTATASQAIGPQIIKNVGFDPVNGFTPVSLFAITQNVLVVHPAMPAKSVKELLAYTKANPGKLNLANAGSGTQSHLAGVLLAHTAGINVLHVPYKGGGPSVGAVVGNESQATITPGPAVMGHVRAGRLRALASGGAKRSQLTPDLPTLVESGINMESTGWIGFLAPPKTPKPITEKLYGALKQAVSDPATQKLMESQGADPETTGPEVFHRFIAAEYKRFGEAIRVAKLKPE